MQVLQRLVGLLVRPREEWDRIAAEPPSVEALIGRYLVPLSLLAPIATSIGMRAFDDAWGGDRGGRVPTPEIYAAAATTMLASISSVLALAGIFVLIAPMYGSTRDYKAALQVATYGTVPLLLAGATLFIPAMAMVAVVALVHSLYLYWLGARRVLHVARKEQAEFVGISVVLLSVSSTIVGAIASRIGIF